MEIKFTFDEILNIIDYYNKEEVDLDEKIKAVADNELILVKDYFENIIDQQVYLTDDYIRLRLFFIHWYAAFRTLLYYHKNLSDINYINKKLLLESFGYFFHYLNTEETQEMLCYNLNKFYAYNGTPKTIISIIESVGILGYKLVEYLLYVVGKDLKFVPKAAFSNQTLTIYEKSSHTLRYEDVVREDPHWYYTDEEIWDLLKNNEDSLPAMTPYFGLVKNIDWFYQMRKVVMKIKRHLRKQLQIWIDTGILLDEILFDFKVENYRYIDDLSLLELYSAFVYLYKIHYDEATDITNETKHIGETKIEEEKVYDNVLYIDEFDNVFQKRRFTKEDRENIIKNRLENWYNSTPNDYPFHTTDDYKNILLTLNPDLLDFIIANKDNLELLKAFLERLHDYCLIYYEIDAPFKYMIFDDKINDDILSLLNYFKPFPSRMILFRSVFIINDLPGDQFLGFDILKNTKIKLFLKEYVGFAWEAWLYPELLDGLHNKIDYTIWEFPNITPVVMLKDYCWFYNPFPILIDPNHHNMIDFTVRDSYFMIITDKIKEIYEMLDHMLMKLDLTIEEYVGYDKDIRSMFDYRIRELVFFYFHLSHSDIMTYLSLPNNNQIESRGQWDNIIVEWPNVIPVQLGRSSEQDNYYDEYHIIRRLFMTDIFGVDDRMLTDFSVYDTLFQNSKISFTSDSLYWITLPYMSGKEQRLQMDLIFAEYQDITPSLKFDSVDDKLNIYDDFISISRGIKFEDILGINGRGILDFNISDTLFSNPKISFKSDSLYWISLPYLSGKEQRLLLDFIFAEYQNITPIIKNNNNIINLSDDFTPLSRGLVFQDYLGTEEKAMLDFNIFEYMDFTISHITNELIRNFVKENYHIYISGINSYEDYKNYLKEEVINPIAKNIQTESIGSLDNYVLDMYFLDYNQNDLLLINNDNNKTTQSENTEKEQNDGTKIIQDVNEDVNINVIFI